MPSNSGNAFPSAEELAAWLPQYELQSCVSTGQQSIVYLALQPALDRQVMIRVMPEPDAKDLPVLMDRLRIRARLVHPKIVSVFDFGKTPGGPLYLVTEHVDGSLLSDLIKGGQVTPKQAYQLSVQLCDTLQVVHDHHAIHGALSARTVLVTRDWQLKLTGIGMMEAADGELTWLGDSSATFDDDIEALGRVIHEMFCGVPPAPKGAAPPSLPPSFARVVARCLDAEPSRRYERPSDVRAALAEALRAEKQAAAAPASAAVSRTPAHLPPRGAPAPAPPRIQPGHIPLPTYHPPPRRSFMRRIDDFLWGALRASLHLMIFGGTLVVIIGYALLKDKIVFTDPEAEQRAGALAAQSKSLDELNGRYLIAVRNAARTAVVESRGADVTALQREMRLLEQGKPIPDTDEADLPEVLKRLRKDYRAEKARLAPAP